MSVYEAIEELHEERDKKALECAEYLKSYCEKKVSCRNCVAHTFEFESCSVCKLKEYPYNWKLPQPRQCDGNMSEIERNQRTAEEAHSTLIIGKVEDDHIVNPVDITSSISPDHYRQGYYQCLEEMQISFGADWVRIFCILNAYKYKYRANFKGKYEEDLKKAETYLKWADYIEANICRGENPHGVILDSETIENL